MKIGETLSALMVVNPNGNRTIFAQMAPNGMWTPFVFAERAALDRCIIKVRDSLDAMKEQKGIKFEICTYLLADRSPLD
jgi:hypothetical protein